MNDNGTELLVDGGFTNLNMEDYYLTRQNLAIMSH